MGRLIPFPRTAHTPKPAPVSAPSAIESLNESLRVIRNLHAQLRAAIDELEELVRE
jgi:hypothetical protein